MRPHLGYIVARAHDMLQTGCCVKYTEPVIELIRQLSYLYMVMSLEALRI